MRGGMTMRGGCAVVTGLWLSAELSAIGPTPFAMSDSGILFGRYDELRLVTPRLAETIRPPVEVGYNHAYFAYPSLSPRGDTIAWGFVREWQENRSKNRARFVVGLYALASKTWSLYGDFDDIGPVSFSTDGSKLAFYTSQNNRFALVVFDVRTHAMTTVPSPQGLPKTSMSWAPDAKHLAVGMGSSGTSQVGILDVESGSARPLADGSHPAWSPNGDWIAYFDLPGAHCIVVHPDGTGTRVVKTLRQAWFSYRRFGWGGPVWSPDSRRLLLDVMKGDGDFSDTILVDVESGHATTMATNSWPVFGWSKVGKH